MLGLYAISILVSLFIGCRSVRLMRIVVQDRKLGFEEMICLSIIIGMCLNISIDMMNAMIPASLNALHIRQVAVVSRLTEALVGYSILEYVYKMHNLRFGTKEK